MTTPQQLQSSERRIDLDWVRILAFGLLIFYHVGMLYVSWGFHIKSVHRLTWLEPLEASIVILGTALTCVATYEVVRRIARLRPLFGLRTVPRTVAGMEQHQPA